MNGCICGKLMNTILTVAHLLDKLNARERNNNAFFLNGPVPTFQFIETLPERTLLRPLLHTLRAFALVRREAWGHSAKRTCAEELLVDVAIAKGAMVVFPLEQTD